MMNGICQCSNDLRRIGLLCIAFGWIVGADAVVNFACK